MGIVRRERWGRRGKGFRVRGSGKEVRGRRSGGTEQPEQPLRSASAATEQPNSLSAAGRRRSLVNDGIFFVCGVCVEGVFPETWNLKPGTLWRGQNAEVRGQGDRTATRTGADRLGRARTVGEGRGQNSEVGGGEGEDGGEGGGVGEEHEQAVHAEGDAAGGGEVGEGGEEGFVEGIGGGAAGEAGGVGLLEAGALFGGVG